MPKAPSNQSPNFESASRGKQVMGHRKRWPVASLVFLCLPLTACQELTLTPTHADEPPPATVVHIEGSELSRVLLTERAIQRIALKTDQVRERQVSRLASPRKVVPYSSLIYDMHGETWVYTVPQPRTFVRQKVQVDYIEGDIAVLKDGPPAGVVVASVGVAELYGAELGVGH